MKILRVEFLAITRRIAWCVLAVNFCTVQGLAARPYAIQKLGALAGGSSVARDTIAGQVVGNSGESQDENKAFIWKAGKLTFLGFLPGGDYSSAQAVSRNGYVAGMANTETNVHAFLWNPRSGMHDLGSFPGDTASAAFGLNEHRQVVGYTSGVKGVRAAMWTPTGEIELLGSLPGDNFSQAHAINNSGQVVGVSGDGNRERAFLWSSKTGMQDLGFLPGDSGSIALAINEAGEVVGNSIGPSGTHAFIWTKGSMRSLGEMSDSPCSQAVDINTAGEVVGVVHTNLGPRAFLWSRERGMQDLNELIGDQNIVLLEALALDDNGLIVTLGLEAADAAHTVEIDHEAHAGPSTIFVLTNVGAH
jgi:probable HAF family extracellular repeat protein